MSDQWALSVSENQRGELRTSEVAAQLTASGGKPGQGYPLAMVYPTLSAHEGGTLTQIPPVLISSTEDSPARIYPWPETGPVLGAPAAVYGMSFDGSCPNCGRDGAWSRMFQGFTVPPAARTSRSSHRGWLNSGTAWLGESSTVSFSEQRSDEGESLSLPRVYLSDVLEPSVAPKYFLSANAARGILRRAERRGKALPEHLAAALALAAGQTTPTE